MTPDAPREDFLLALPGVEMPAAVGFHQWNRHGPLIIADHEYGLPVSSGDAKVLCAGVSANARGAATHSMRTTTIPGSFRKNVCSDVFTVFVSTRLR